jgi:hypothetical protein
MMKTALFSYNRFALTARTAMMKNQLLASSGMILRTNHTFTYSTSDLGKNVNRMFFNLQSAEDCFLFWRTFNRIVICLISVLWLTCWLIDFLRRYATSSFLSTEHYLLIWFCSTVIWCDVMWCDTIYYIMNCTCDVMWCHVIWCSVIWYNVMWYDMIWYDVIWHDVIWCDVIWYDVM